MQNFPTHTSRLTDPVLQEGSGNECFDSIRKDVVTLPEVPLSRALAKPERISNAMMTSEFRERAGADDLRARPREPALIGFWEALVQLIADHEIKDRVAEKLQSLIVSHVGGLVSKARMSHRLKKQRRRGFQAEKLSRYLFCRAALVHRRGS